MLRPDWDDTWWEMAQVIGRRSKCERRAIGAVVVDYTNRPVSMGYNGPPRHLTEVTVSTEQQYIGRDIRTKLPAYRTVKLKQSTDQPCEMWCPRAMSTVLKDPGASYENCYTIHAEVNALLFADRRDYEGGTIYVTSVPCWECAKAVANSGLSSIVTRITDEDAHRNPSASVDLLTDSGLAVILR